MTEKFERIKETKKHNESGESVIFSLIFFFLIILGALWYYQNKTMTESGYIQENEIKILEQKQNDLEEKIKKVLEENMALNKEKNTASILLPKQ
jgi:hypothetical protein